MLVSVGSTIAQPKKALSDKDGAADRGESGRAGDSAGEMAAMFFIGSQCDGVEALRCISSTLPLCADGG